MSSTSRAATEPPAPTFAQLFTPKLVTVLREGYGFDKFQRDLIAGLTVAIVALPLSMAIAIASGVSPDRGLFTAIVGGLIGAALLFVPQVRELVPQLPELAWPVIGAVLGYHVKR